MIERRDILKAGAASVALAAGNVVAASRPLRVGFVGVGGRGTSLLDILLKLDSVEVPALGDINENNLRRAQNLVEKSGKPRPEGYSRSETDFRRLCDRNDLDLVINATPWQWHVPISVAALKAGKHAATEVPAAVTIEECWELVETAESTGKYVAMLENDCYGRNELMVLNMLRDGLLGEPMFAEAGYMHDLRTVQYNLVPHGEPWRLDHSIKRNGNQYPTHQMGPISMWMDINRGDAFSYLVSMSSNAVSMQEFAIKQFGPNDARAKTRFAQGDVNTTLIRTEKGRTISLYFDTGTPRPKEHMVRIQGSKGVYSFMLDKIMIDGRGNRKEGARWMHNQEWEAVDEYRKQYEHKLWKTQGENAKSSGHGGIDYMTMYRLVKNFREGKPPDVDVYTAASCSVISGLSERSVAERSRPMDFPDFTRGKWKLRAPIDPDEIV
jgi:predicted dehydrogenase